MDLRGAEIIGYCAFQDCSSLTTIKNTSKVGIVSTGAFYNCPLLEELNLSNVGTVCEGAFLNCPRLRKLNLSHAQYIQMGDLIKQKDFLSYKGAYNSIIIRGCPVEELITPESFTPIFFLEENFNEETF